MVRIRYHCECSHEEFLPIRNGPPKARIDKSTILLDNYQCKYCKRSFNVIIHQCDDENVYESDNAEIVLTWLTGKSEDFSHQSSLPSIKKIIAQNPEILSLTIERKENSRKSVKTEQTPITSVNTTGTQEFSPNSKEIKSYTGVKFYGTLFSIVMACYLLRDSIEPKKLAAYLFAIWAFYGVFLLVRADTLSKTYKNIKSLILWIAGILLFSFIFGSLFGTSSNAPDPTEVFFRK